MLAKFSGIVSKSTISKCGKEKKLCCVHLLHWTLKISKSQIMQQSCNNGFKKCT